MSDMYDLVIVGGGIVSLVTALSVAQRSGLRIAVLMPAPTISPASTSRVYALVPHTQRFLTELGVWSQLITNAQLGVVAAMHVWSAHWRTKLAVSHAELAVPALAYIVTDHDLYAHLMAAIAQCPHIVLVHSAFVACTVTAEAVVVTAQDETLTARLVIGADGGNSLVRHATNIACHTASYGQSSIVAQCVSTRPHQQCAQQFFAQGPLSNTGVPIGPLALLPMADQQHYAVVWSMATAAANELLKLSDTQFCRKLNRATRHYFPDLGLMIGRSAYPLMERHAWYYTKERVALVGDAIHTFHPLAGQGLNLSIADAASLSKVITSASALGDKFYTTAVLRRYERERYVSNCVMLNAVKVINKAVMTDNRVARAMVAASLAAVNYAGPLKRGLVQYAMGDRLGALPIV